MLLRLPNAKIETPHVRWRRGLVVDVDPEYSQPLLEAGAKEITREEAAEVVVDPLAAPAGEGQVDEPGGKPKGRGKG